MKTKADKVKFLNDLAAGKASIAAIQPLRIRHWKACIGKPDWLTCEDDGSQYHKHQLPRGLNILNIINISGGQPQRNKESDVIV